MKNIWINKLKEKGMRITEQRKAVIDSLIKAEKALEPIEVYDLVRQEYPSIGMVTVYRTMECLSDLHLLQKVHQESGCNKYLRGKDGHHHLMICTQCGKANYFKGLELEDEFQRIASSHHFQIEDHWLQLSGVCQDCQQRTAQQQER